MKLCAIKKVKVVHFAGCVIISDSHKRGKDAAHMSCVCLIQQTLFCKQINACGVSQNQLIITSSAIWFYCETVVDHLVALREMHNFKRKKRKESPAWRSGKVA